MPAGRGIKRIPLSRATNLPRLTAPAGYVVVIEDVDLGSRFIIARMQEVNSRALARATDLAFETKLFLVLSAANAGALARELHDRFAADGDLNEWFDLDPAQVAQLRDFGRPAAPSLRDLALSAVEGQSLVEQSRVVSARRQAQPPAPSRAAAHPAGSAPRRRQRRWVSWLLLIAIAALGASVLGNAPQLRRLLSGETSLQEMLAPGRVPASATAKPSPTRLSATLPPTAIASAGDVFYVLARANARTCASRECRAPVILEVGTRIDVQWYESGQQIDGNKTWIAYRRGDTILYIHSSVLSRDRVEVTAAERPSSTATLTVVPSATFTHTAAPTATSTQTPTPEPTDTVTPTFTVEPGNARAPAAAATDSPEPSATATETTATAAPTETETPTATATAAELPTVLYIDTANSNLNANVRACPSTECEILGRLRPGAEIRPTGEAAGEVINGIAQWVEVEYDGQTAFVHGELVAEGP